MRSVRALTIAVLILPIVIASSHATFLQVVHCPQPPQNPHISTRRTTGMIQVISGASGGMPLLHIYHTKPSGTMLGSSFGKSSICQMSEMGDQPLLVSTTLINTFVSAECFGHTGSTGPRNGNPTRYLRVG